MKDKLIFSDGLTIDFSKRSITYKQKLISLAKKEFDIVELLVKNSGEILSKEVIYERVWRQADQGKSRVVAEHIRRIRTKLGLYSQSNYIETIWRTGYKWAKIN